MIKKLLSLVIAIFPLTSYANQDDKSPKVYIEKEGKVYELVDQLQIEEIIEYAEILEIDPEQFEPEELPGWISQSSDDLEK